MGSRLDDFYLCTKKDMVQAGIVGADSFQDDPMWSAILEGEPKDKLSICLEMSFRHCRRYGVVYAPENSMEALMGVVPGKFCNMNLWRMFMAGSLPIMGKMGSKLGEKMGKYFDPLIRDQKENMAGKEYVYLFILGVKKDLQGKGMGGKLLRALIEDCEKSGKSIYLETETEVNVKIYEHFGFKTLKKTALVEIDSPIWEMVWEPNSEK